MPVIELCRRETGQIGRIASKSISMAISCNMSGLWKIEVCYCPETGLWEVGAGLLGSNPAWPRPRAFLLFRQGRFYFRESSLGAFFVPLARMSSLGWFPRTRLPGTYHCDHSGLLLARAVFNINPDLSWLFHRHPLIQIFKPVQDDVDR
jgi:hypothetical protein